MHSPDRYIMNRNAGTDQTCTDLADANMARFFPKITNFPLSTEIFIN